MRTGCLPGQAGNPKPSRVPSLRGGKLDVTTSGQHICTMELVLRAQPSMEKQQRPAQEAHKLTEQSGAGGYADDQPCEGLSPTLSPLTTPTSKTVCSSSLRQEREERKKNIRGKSLQTLHVTEDCNCYLLQDFSQLIHI